MKVCEKCGCNDPYHDAFCPTRNLVQACRNHVPAFATKLPSDDSKLTCGVCKHHGYDVGLYDVQPR